MLPSAKNSLMKGGFSPGDASWILIACFIGGVLGIQFVSSLMHHFIPHHAVGCEHVHDDESQKEGGSSHEHDHSNGHAHPHSKSTRPESKTHGSVSGDVQRQHDTKPSSPHSSNFQNPGIAPAFPTTKSSSKEYLTNPRGTSKTRLTLQTPVTDTFSNTTAGKDCAEDCESPCYGYSDLCQSTCFKNVNAGVNPPKPTAGVNRPSAVKMATATESTPLLQKLSEGLPTRPETRAAVESTNAQRADFEHDAGASDTLSAAAVDIDGTNDPSRTRPHGSLHPLPHSHHRHHDHDHDHDHEHESGSEYGYEHEHAPEDHHHHVPTNAFLSIGLQTCLAIALHKLPEGFITYATNHANPQLGVTVFLSLFIHNITEGFALALPLYLAINNRMKAMFYSFLLGGLSQPAGAGVAALWFHLAGGSGWQPNEAGYGGMFAVTAGILASVALQLFRESLELTHSKHLCILGAFTGMFILGISSALTA